MTRILAYQLFQALTDKESKQMEVSLKMGKSPLKSSILVGNSMK
jgi:hypothetical protein